MTITEFYRGEAPIGTILTTCLGESYDKRGLALYVTEAGEMVWVPKRTVTA